MVSLGGRCGHRRKEIESESDDDGESGNIFWFSIPLKLPEPETVGTNGSKAIDGGPRVPGTAYPSSTDMVNSDVASDNQAVDTVDSDSSL